MASGSTPTRINQFFASRKRKAQSPTSKAASLEKNAPISVAHPIGKCDLGIYLVAHRSEERPSCSSGTFLDEQDTVHINSESNPNLLPDDISKQQHSQFPDSSDVNNMDVNTQTSGNSELMQFASSFLSLYCGELHSSKTLSLEAKGITGNSKGNPTFLIAENKSNGKKHRSSPGSPGTDKNRQPNIPVSNQGFECSEPIKPFGIFRKGAPSTLRKCNNVHGATGKESVVGTPSQLNQDVRSRVTPNSACGSSMFSPGEAFWSEAIEVADDLFDRNKISLQNGYKNVGAAVEDGVKNTKGKNFSVESKMIAGLHATEMHTYLCASSRPQLKTLARRTTECSPIPVKYFDFSNEVEGGPKSSQRQHSSHDAEGMHTKVQSCNDHSFDKHGDFHVTERDCEFDEMGMLHKTITIQPKSENDSVVLCHGDENKISSTPSADRKGLATSVKSEQSTPLSLSEPMSHMDAGHWLPSEICSIYESKGVRKLYPWQVDCLQVEGVLGKKNLVYCASTSAGKSFVAEILMLRRVLSSGKIAFLVLPYVSICAEKAEHLETLLNPLGKHVRSYYGNQGGGNLPKDTSIAVCTIEKANSLINRLLEDGRLSEIGIVVIDELHMVGDQNRGYLLELLLTKLLYATEDDAINKSCSGESSGTSSNRIDTMHGLQIIGMSATMPNAAAVADWLQAALYETDFRPVPLEEYIKVGCTILNNKLEIVRTLAKNADHGGKDPDHIIELCDEVVQEGNSVLVFCSSRKGCESTARHIARFLKTFSNNMFEDNSEVVDISSVIRSLQKCPYGLDPILEETLPCGVAYHHAGLMLEEREIIETCYRRGLVRVLTATSTLAAGVNLPARRVIFRQPKIGRDFLDGTRYKQMAGRAGRTGIDTKGESILICKQEEIKRITSLLGDGFEPLLSCLSDDKNGMTHAILEVVAGGIVQTASDINRYVRCTLLNSVKPFDDVVRSAQDSLRWLCHHNFIEWNEELKLYNTTPLGRASFGSSLSPEDSLIVLDDLARAREGFVLASDLHLVYLVTPTSVEIEPDWEMYYERFMGLTLLEQSVGNRVGVAEPFLMRMAHGAPIRLLSAGRSKGCKNFLRNSVKRSGIITTDETSLSDNLSLRVCKRFYVALILSSLVQEAPVAEVCEMFKVARGMVQSLQENAGRFASMVSVFCERLGWHDLEGLVSRFQNRVSFGVKAEIVELTTIAYVKGSRARALYKYGLRTPQAVAEASVSEIVKALFEISSWERQESAHRVVQFGVAKKIRNAARKMVLDKAEEARAAAFSAFKSLGLDVVQLCRPLVGGVELDTVAGTLHSTGNSTFIDDDKTKRMPDVGKEVSKVSERSDTTETDARCVASVELPNIEVECSPEGGSNGTDTPSKCGAVSVEALNIFSSDRNDASISTLNVTFLHPGGVDDVAGGTSYSSAKECVNDNGPANAIHFPGGLDSLLKLWESTPEFWFDIHFNEINDFDSHTAFEINGIAICWENSNVYYISIPRDLVWPNGKIVPCKNDHTASKGSLEEAEMRWSAISQILCRENAKRVSWNLKMQIQVLKAPIVSLQRFGSLKHAMREMNVSLLENKYFQFSPILLQGAIDMSIVAWILWPDEERSSCPSLEKEVKRRLPIESAAAAHRSGRWKNQMHGAAHNGCCRRVAQTRAVSFTLWKLLLSESLVEQFTCIEVPLVNVLADMETCGICVDMDGCLQARTVLGKKLHYLEKEIYGLAGIRFSLSSAADIAHVLYTHLKLPITDRSIKGKKHPSTDKYCLDMLRNEHPIIPLVKEHRTLAKIMHCTLGAICSRAKLSTRSQRYMLHGHWLQTSTATGRVSIEEPNLQCVEHPVHFQMRNCDNSNSDEEHRILNARDFFLPSQENWLLLAADYSQIELRVMAHFSRDASLIELLGHVDGDVFTMITSRWTGKLKSCVTSEERESTKGLVYGILYGMGPKTLAEKLDCTCDEAVEKIQSFKNSFPGVASWLGQTILSCKEKGYVETISGRKRFLPKIKLGNKKEKSKAQRQAVNSICQGSAADIIKIAMIHIHDVLVDHKHPPQLAIPSEKFSMLENRCRILLQVHDELLLEVHSSLLNDAAMLLKHAMESAASLLVPLHVKLKFGKTWGSLEPFCPQVKGEEKAL